MMMMWGLYNVLGCQADVPESETWSVSVVLGLDSLTTTTTNHHHHPQPPSPETLVPASGYFSDEDNSRVLN